MIENLVSEGKCLFCSQIISQKEIGNHLAKHLAEIEKTDTNKKTQNYRHIVVDAYEMFLHMLVKGNAKMQNIDKFLRAIWLECCGHMSEFGHEKFEIEMKDKVQDVLKPRVIIYHDYDFGTTTRVLLKGLKKYNLSMNESIILLSRNEPLKFMCASCKVEPAVNLCAECMLEEYSFFCESCSEEHEDECDSFTDYASLPIVNSPRMGDCGYTGGSYDLERDGVYKKR